VTSAVHSRVERNHQGLGNELIEASNDNSVMTGCVLRRKRIGGLLNFCYRTGRDDRLLVLAPYGGQTWTGAWHGRAPDTSGRLRIRVPEEMSMGRFEPTVHMRWVS
jgi:hypothetical protein